jgi:hypothetical protein
MELGDLQMIQRADGPDKESKILAQGFDVHSDFVLGGKKMRRFNKCWKGNAGKARYEQVILWNSSANQLMFLLSDESEYLALRTAIEGRHNSSNAQKGDDFYIGTVFRYHYSVQQLDAEPYFTVGIAFK